MQKSIETIYSFYKLYALVNEYLEYLSSSLVV